MYRMVEVRVRVGAGNVEGYLDVDLPIVGPVSSMKQSSVDPS